VEIIPHVLEESIEILLNDLELAPQEVPPLDQHIVESHESVIKHLQPLGLRNTIQHFS
jgi:hypothetical protein